MKTILVIEDDAEIRGLIKQSFELCGCIVIEACNGSAALLALTQTKVDLILTDIEMPIMNGVQFLKEFRRANKITPVLVMTGGSRYSRQEILELGATAYFEKPFSKFNSILEVFAS